ncbi:uncharacterized protein JCM15063_005565 [Sporobolomyces koalae]|uniref:uncharacterized protein n=1 Tax=Sporobolomyces koalae TaxID=500713 RepID=UPI00316E9B01
MPAPSTSEVDRPLLGSEDAAKRAYHPSRRRIPRRLIFISALLLFLMIWAALAYSDHKAFQPLQDRIHNYLLASEQEEANEGIAQEPRQWSKQDQQLRKYEWQTPEPHASLAKVVSSLSSDQDHTRSWLLETRPESMGATGIGLGATDPPEPIRASSAGSKHKSRPEALEGPGLFSKGSPEKYQDLVEEWKTGRPVQACEKGNWEDEYTQLHSEIMKGDRPPSLLEFSCAAGQLCGGIADRFLGMVSTFLYSILTRRAFSISWEQPAPFDMLFDSPNIDWSRPYTNSSKTPPQHVYRDASLKKAMTTIDAHNWEEPQIDEFFPSFVENYSDSGSTPWLKLAFNRGVVIRSYAYDTVAPQLETLGLKLETAYSCLLNYLVRPKRVVLAFIAQYTSVFALPEYFVIGIQIRTGDTSMYASRKDAVNTVSRHSQYFRCAESVSRTYAHPSQKVLWYLISDSRTLEQDALETYPDKVVVTGLKQSHVEITSGSAAWKGVKGASDGFLRTVAESYIFAGTDFQILTLRSGFGKIPTWLRGKQGSTIQVFNPHMDPEYTRLVKKKNKGKLPPELDCSLDSSLRTFAEMAQNWSLG